MITLNKKFTASLLWLFLLFTGLLSYTVTQIPASAANDRIRICHSTSSDTNPYNSITVAISSVDGDAGNNNGQGDHYLEHTGPLWYDGIANNSWGDIIPPLPGIHDGLNWTTEGQAVYNNNCSFDFTASSPSPTPSTSPSPSPSATPDASPTPNPGNSSKLGFNVTCPDNSVEVTFDARDSSNNPVENQEVTFRYNSIENKSSTNADGRARTFFSKASSNLFVQAEASNFPSQQAEIKLPSGENCVDSSPTPTPPAIGSDTFTGLEPVTERGVGQVLGVSTLAATGKHAK